MIRRSRLIGAAGVCLIVLFVAWTAKHTGAGIDQYADQQYFINNLNGFVHNSRFPFVQFGPNDVAVESSYGYTFQAITFIASWALASIRNDAFNPFSAGTYTDKNVMVALLAIGAFWAVYHATRSLTGRRRTAVAATVILALSPVFTGHALMNQKDIPLAVGFTALTAGTIALVGRLQRRQTMDDRALTRRFGSATTMGVLLGTGIAFTIGTRPGSVVVVLLDLAIIVAVVVSTKAHTSWRLLQAAVIGLCSGTAVVLATNSAAWPNPVSWLLHGIDVARGFPSWRGKVLVDGLFHNYDAQPRWYLPFMLAVQTPVIIAVLTVIAAWFLLTRLISARHPARSLLLWSPLAVQLLVLPLAGVLQGSLFYNAARQALFVLPAMAIVAAVGLQAIDRMVTGRRVRIAVASVVAIAALSPVVDTVTLFPYQYVYFNELERTDDLTDRFEFDYWGISARETQQWVNRHYPSAVEVYPIGWQFPPFGNGTVTFAGNWNSAGDRERIFAANYYPSWEVDQYFDCPIVHRVTRQLWASEIVLGYVRRCTGIR